MVPRGPAGCQGKEVGKWRWGHRLFLGGELQGDIYQILNKSLLFQDYFCKGYGS